MSWLDAFVNVIGMVSALVGAVIAVLTYRRQNPTLHVVASGGPAGRRRARRMWWILFGVLLAPAPFYVVGGAVYWGGNALIDSQTGYHNAEGVANGLAVATGLVATWLWLYLFLRRSRSARLLEAWEAEPLTYGDGVAEFRPRFGRLVARWVGLMFAAATLSLLAVANLRESVDSAGYGVELSYLWTGFAFLVLSLAVWAWAVSVLTRNLQRRVLRVGSTGLVVASGDDTPPRVARTVAAVIGAAGLGLLGALMVGQAEVVSTHGDAAAAAGGLILVIAVLVLVAAAVGAVRIVRTRQRSRVLAEGSGPRPQQLLAASIRYYPWTNLTEVSIRPMGWRFSRTLAVKLSTMDARPVRVFDLAGTRLPVEEVALAVTQHSAGRLGGARSISAHPAVAHV